MNTILSGCFFARSASIFVSFNKNETVNCWNNYLHRVKIQDSDFYAYKFNNSKKINDLEEISPILVRHHELAHYRSLVSSPFGLFIFRLLTALSSSFQYVSRKIAGETKSNYMPDHPYVNWFYEKGRFLIERTKIIDSNHSLRKHLENKMFEIHLYKHLINNLMHQNSLRVGELTNLINDSLRLIKIQQEISDFPKITSKLSKDSFLVKDQSLTVESLIEAIARISELQGLTSFNVS